MTGAVILFDGDCALCCGVVRWLLKRDCAGRFCYAPLTGKTAAAVALRHPFSEGNSEGIRLVLDFETPAERVLSRAEAVVEIAWQLGGIYRVAVLARGIPRGWRDGLYGVVERNRYRWFGWAKCAAVEAGRKNLFLS